MRGLGCCFVVLQVFSGGLFEDSVAVLEFFKFIGVVYARFGLLFCSSSSF